MDVLPQGCQCHDRKIEPKWLEPGTEADHC